MAAAGVPHALTPAQQEARFLAALEQARHDYAMAWEVFGAAFVAQTVLLGFVGLALAATNPQVPRWEFIAAALLGIAFWIPWFVSFQRNAATHVFRVHLAWTYEPPGWNLLGGHGRDMAEGRQVVLDLPDGTRRCFQMPWYARMSTRYGITSLQVVLVLIYLALGGAALVGLIGKA